MADNIESALKSVREDKKRKFNQTIDLIINIKGVDLKKPENKFSKRVVLPHGRGKDVSICVIGEKGDITKDDVITFERDKSGAKKLSKKYEFFVCEAPVMPLVGKILGRYLAPKGKMPELLLPGKNLESVIDELKRSVRVRLKDSPSIQTIIGTEGMTDSQITENANHVIEEVKKSLPPKAQIKNAFVKTTMGKPSRIGV